jgi:16S rRNA (cytosine1402-N4)-methyltransferase
MQTEPHIPIMVEAILNGLRASEIPAAQWIDGTLGAGGHSTALLSARDDSRLLGLDLDPNALNLAAAKLAPFGERAILRHGSYETMPKAALDWNDGAKVDGILLDLGISSMQIDQPERGFAFRFEGPLDMRFDPTENRPTAADLVNDLPATNWPIYCINTAKNGTAAAWHVLF